MFAELVNLEWLYLGENQLTTLPGGVFENLVGLRELYLQTNQIASLPAGVFQGLGNLRELNLGDGQLATLPAEIFHSLSSLVTLSLRTNQLSSFPVGVFDGLTSLEGLLLEDNQLTTLPAGVFEGLGRLEYLALYRNPLDNLPAGVFKGLASLVDLDLELNPFTTLPAGVFEGLTSLEDLSLFGNQLSVLPAGVFVGLANLLQLDLRSNQLTILQSGVFDGLTKLRTLQLSGNQLTSLSPGAFAGLNSLIDINLEDNPGAPFTLKMELERVGLGALSGTAQLRLGVAEGAPFAATATWAATGPLIGTRSNRVTIPGGSLKSEPFSVTGANGGGQVSVSLSEEAFRVDSGSSVGLRLTTGEPLLLDFGPNQSPVATGQVPANADIAIGSAMTIDLSKYFDDPDGGPLTYSVSSSHTLVARVSLSGDIVTIFPAAGGSATVTAGASDPGGLSVTQKFPVTVDGDHVGLPTGDWTPDLVSRASFSNVDGQTTIAFEHGGRIDDEGIIYTCMSSRGCTIEGRSVEMGRIQAAQALAVSELLLAGLAELVDDKTVFFEKTYNGFELNESTVTTRSVAGEITRVSFLDLDGDLVFADFSSDSPASEMIVNLDEFSGTLEASPYNQPDAQYARGLATIWIMNPTEHTWLSVVSLGNHIDRVDLALIKADSFAGAVNGMADIRAIRIEGDGSIGAIDAANANFVGSSDEFGIDAAGTVVRRALTIGDLAPSEAARPLLRINGNSLNPANVGQGETLIDGIRIAGGDLAEATGDRQIDTAEVRYQFPIVAEDGELSIRDSNLRPDLGDGQLPAVTDTFVANPDSYFVTDGQTTGIGDTAD